MRKIIAVEGFDGSGKTKISKIISNLYNYEYRKSPCGAFATGRFVFDSDMANKKEKTAYYLADCMIASLQMKENLHQSYVLDRYYYSTLAYHFNSPNDIAHEFWAIAQALIKPTTILYLKNSYSIAKQRIKERNNSLDNEYYLTSFDYSRIDRNFRHIFDSPIIEIDTSYSWQETLNEIMNIGL